MPRIYKMKFYCLNDDSKVITTAIEKHDPEVVPVANHDIEDFISKSKEKNRASKKNHRKIDIFDDIEEDVEDEFFRVRRTSGDNIVLEYS